MPTQTSKWGSVYLGLAILALVLSIPSLVSIGIGGISSALSCTGGFVDASISCASQGNLPIYGTLVFMALVGIAFGLILIPLTLVLAIVALVKAWRSMEAGKKRTWTLVLSALAILIQIYPLYILVTALI